MTRTWIFTFGYGHVHPETGEPLRRRFVRITAPSELDARREMFRRFGRQWSMVYDSELQAGVARYGLTELVES